MPSFKSSSRSGLGVLALTLALVASACGGGGGGSSPSDVTLAPTFSPPAGTYSSAQSVTLSSATAGASIFYTTDGSIPSSASTQYLAPIAVSASTTIKAIAVAPGNSTSSIAEAVYTLTTTLPQVEAPTFNPPAGTYGAVQSVTISSATAGASVFYTTDGAPPTSSSIPYTGTISVPLSATIRAIATHAGYRDSPETSAAYVIDFGPAAAPTFSPPPGDFPTAVSLSSSSTGATIYYTTGGGAPTTRYTGPIPIPEGAQLTIRAIATGAGWSDSPIASATYTSAILVSLPFATITAGCYPSGSGLGSRGESVWATRASTATYLDAAGNLHSCAANELRVGCDPASGACGLLVEPAATQLHPSPSAPAAGPVTFTATGWHEFWVVGPGSQTIDLAAGSTLVATRVGGLPAFPCTASAVSPCEFQVTTLGAAPTAALSAVAGTLTRAQIEANEYRTSFVPSGTRAADVAWIDNPLAGTLNLALWSEDLATPAHWFPNSVTVTGGQADSLGGTSAVLATAGTSGHTYVQENITVAENTAYTWSFEAKNDGGTGASYSVYCLSSATNIVPSTSYVGQLSGTAWTRVVVPFVTPPGCTAVNVYLLRDSVAPVSLFLAHPQLEPGSAFTSYSRTLGFPIASDASGGSWCVKGTWTPENGAPWLSDVRSTHYRVISTLENDDRNSFFLSYAWSSALTWDVFGKDKDSKRLVPTPTFTPGSTHTVAGAYDHGAITLYNDGVSVGTPAGTGTGVMDAQKAKLGLTPLAGDSPSQPFGGFASDVKVFRRATCQ